MESSYCPYSGFLSLLAAAPLTRDGAEVTSRLSFSMCSTLRSWWSFTESTLRWISSRSEIEIYFLKYYNVYRITCQIVVRCRERTGCVMNECWATVRLILFDHAGMFWCLQSLTADDTRFMFILRLPNIPFLLLYFLFVCCEQEPLTMNVTADVSVSIWSQQVIYWSTTAGVTTI